MSYIKKIRSLAAKAPKRIVLSEGCEDRVIQAAIEATVAGLGQMILVGPLSTIENKISNFLPKEKAKLSRADIKIVDPKNSDLKHEFAKCYMERRKGKDIGLEDALEMVSSPLVFSALMVHLNYADGTVGGAVYTTTETVRTAMQVLGIKKDKDRLSSFFIMVCEKSHHFRKEPMIYADCGVIVNPSIDDLANSAIVANDWYKRLIGDKPVVAMLSFSTLGSAKHPVINKVIKAKEVVIARRPDIAIEGELQFDAAFMPEIAEIKAQDSKLAGTSNVFIFPNLETGNIAYKITERMAGAVAIGPILDGLNKPANDVSRGCSTQDIVNVIAITNIQAQFNETT